jgi:hypothetical protein
MANMEDTEMTKHDFKVGERVEVVLFGKKKIVTVTGHTCYSWVNIVTDDGIKTSVDYRRMKHI